MLRSKFTLNRPDPPMPSTVTWLSIAFTGMCCATGERI